MFLLIHSFLQVLTLYHVFSMGRSRILYHVFEIMLCHLALGFVSIKWTITLFKLWWRFWCTVWGLKVVGKLESYHLRHSNLFGTMRWLLIIIGFNEGWRVSSMMVIGDHYSAIMKDLASVQKMVNQTKQNGKMKDRMRAHPSRQILKS